MVESEEVSLQATAEARERFCCSKCDREVVPQFGGQEGEFSGTSRSLTWRICRLTIYGKLAGDKREAIVSHCGSYTSDPGKTLLGILLQVKMYYYCKLSCDSVYYLMDIHNT